MAGADQVVAVLNAGSSSLKFSLYDEVGEELSLSLKGQIEGLYTDEAHFTAVDLARGESDDRRWTGEDATHPGAARRLLSYLFDHLGGRHVDGVGHRIVHGGTDFTGPARLDSTALQRLDRLAPLAPLHQPHNLAPVRAILDSHPEMKQIGCFDTAFHRGQPEVAQLFALPAAYAARGIRRYGFHGLSYEYIATVLPALDPGLAEARVVVAHLGNGASLCALRGGRSVASTMGFTALDGLPMGTRCGALDPGVLLYLIDELKMSPREIEHLLYKDSGLLGVSGISSDMRRLEASDDPRARLAIDLFAYRIGREIGSLAASLGGLDALVFTAGIGEHSAPLRLAVCKAAAWLGLDLDEEANRSGAQRISKPAGKVSAWVVPTDEELMIARHTRDLLA